MTRATRATRARTLALLVGVGVALLLPGGVRAARATTPGISFAESSPVQLTWPLPASGSALTLCNTTLAPLTPRLVITGPEVSVGSTTAQVTDLVAARLSGPIVAGTCSPVMLSGASGASTGNPTSAVSVRITAVSPGVGSAAIDVSLVPSSGPTLLGSFGDITLHATRANPWADSVSLADGRLWLRYSGTPTAIGPHSILVVDGVHKATVAVSVPQQAVDGGLSVPLTVSGAVPPGTYHGTLELGGDHGSIPVTLVVADAVWVLLVGVFVGVLVAFVLRVMTGKWRYRLRLWQARRRVPKRYAQAVVALNPELLRRFPAPTERAVEEWQGAAKKAGREYFRTVATVDVADPTYASVCADVVGVLADAECLQRSFVPALQDLERALTDLGEFLDLTLPTFGDPEVVEVARKLLRVGTTRPPLQVQEATRITDAAVVLTATVVAWRTEAAVLLRHMHWSHRLAHGAEFPDQLQLAAADDALGRAIRELFDAATSAAISAVARGADARDAHRFLSTVGAKRGLWLDDQLDGPMRTRVDSAFADLLPERIAPDDIRLLTRAQRWARGQLRATPFEITHEYVPVAAGAIAWVLVTFSGALVAFATAAFLAYQALYEGKPFGGWPGFLAAVFVGVAAGAVVDALVSGLAWARGGLRSLKT